MSTHRALSLAEALDKRSGWWTLDVNDELGTNLAQLLAGMTTADGSRAWLWEPIPPASVEAITARLVEIIEEEAILSREECELSTETVDAIRRLAETMLAHDVAGRRGLHEVVGSIEVTSELLDALNPRLIEILLHVDETGKAWTLAKAIGPGDARELVASSDDDGATLAVPWDGSEEGVAGALDELRTRIDSWRRVWS